MRWIITLELSEGVSGDDVSNLMHPIAKIAGGRVLQVSSGNWHERTDVTHACPICLAPHLPSGSDK